MLDIKLKFWREFSSALLTFPLLLTTHFSPKVNVAYMSEAGMSEILKIRGVGWVGGHNLSPLYNWAFKIKRVLPPPTHTHIFPASLQSSREEMYADQCRVNALQTRWIVFYHPFGLATRYLLPKDRRIWNEYQSEWYVVLWKQDMLSRR